MKEQMAIEDLAYDDGLPGVGGGPAVQRTYGLQGIRLR
jgi:hypothetical protein